RSRSDRDAADDGLFDHAADRNLNLTLHLNRHTDVDGAGPLFGDTFVHRHLEFFFTAPLFADRVVHFAGQPLRNLLADRVLPRPGFRLADGLFPGVFLRFRDGPADLHG